MHLMHVTKNTCRNLCYDTRVQRMCAVLLLAILSSSLITPLLSAVTPASTIPACCRKDGKHHCSMANMKQQHDDAAAATVKFTTGKCSQFPNPGTVPISCNADAQHATLILYAAIVSHPTAHAQTEAQFRVSFTRSSQKRGPPALIS